MKRIPRFAILLCLMCFSSGLAAQTVSVAARESGPVSDPSPTQTLLSGCLDALFQGGFIATNSTPAAAGPDPWSGIDADIAEAKQGFADYLLAFHVAYSPSALHPGRLEPIALEYRILRVGDASLIAQGKLAIPEDSSDKPKDREKYLSDLGASLAGTFLAQRGIKK